jgi:hypothetical protein
MTIHKDKMTIHKDKMTIHKDKITIHKDKMTIPSFVCVAPPEDEQVMLETCNGP